jgi:hypothetical protein
MHPDHVLGRLDEHAHLVVVVGAGDRDAVHAGADHAAQDLALAGGRAGSVLGVASWRTV